MHAHGLFGSYHKSHPTSSGGLISTDLVSAELRPITAHSVQIKLGQFRRGLQTKLGVICVIWTVFYAIYFSFGVLERQLSAHWMIWHLKTRSLIFNATQGLNCRVGSGVQPPFIVNPQFTFGTESLPVIRFFCLSCVLREVIWSL